MGVGLVHKGLFNTATSRVASGSTFNSTLESKTKTLVSCMRSSTLVTPSLFSVAYL